MVLLLHNYIFKKLLFIVYKRANISLCIIVNGGIIIYFNNLGKLYKKKNLTNIYKLKIF